MKRMIVAFVVALALAMPARADDEAKARLETVKQELKELDKQLGQAKKALDKNEEIVALKQTVKEAQQALEAKTMELLGADPEAAPAVEKRNALIAEKKELETKMRAKPAPEAKEKKKADEGGE